MKLAITGGHLSPALAVITKLPADAQIIFFGRKYGLEGDKAISLEYKAIREMEIPFYSVTTGRLQRKFTRRTLLSLAKIPFGLIQAFSILKREKPDVLLIFGGYLAFPVSIAAYILRVPIVVHEQTLDAGLTNKLVGKFATKICISWETSKKYFAIKKTVLTGNPIRKEIERVGGTSELISAISTNEKVLYVTGGSLGSHAINVVLEGCLKDLLEKYSIIHQTGDAKEFSDFDRLQKFRDNLDEDLRARYVLTKFVNPQEVGVVMRRANLVVSRSGINTVSELLFLKKPALLIPLPYSQAKEQQKNASMLQEIGLAEVLRQDTLTSEKLYTRVVEFMNGAHELTIHENHSTYNNLTNAAENIIGVLQDVVKKD